MTDPKHILIEAPGEMTILAARHLDTEGPVRVGTTVDDTTRSAITSVLRYVSTAHNAPAAPAATGDAVADLAEAFTRAATDPTQRPRVLSDTPPPLDEPAILADLRQARADRNTARARLALAAQALTGDGYFTPDQIGDDIAPRISERLTAHREQLADAELAATEARGETIRVAAVLREVVARYRPLTDRKGRPVGWTALGVTPADFDRWTAVAFTAAGAAEEEALALVNGHADAGDARPVTPATDAPAQPTAPADPDSAYLYRERAHLLSWLATLRPAVITPAPDVDEPDWQLLFLNVDGQQASWHIAPQDAGLFAGVERVGPGDARVQWDGHTTAEKYLRISDHVAEVGQRRLLMPVADAADAPQADARCEVANVPHGPHTWYRNAGGTAHCPGTPTPANGRPSTPATDPGPGPWPLPQRTTRSTFGLTTTTPTPTATVTCGTCGHTITSTISDHMAEAHGIPKIWPSTMHDLVERHIHTLTDDDQALLHGTDQHAAHDGEPVHATTEQHASDLQPAGDPDPDELDWIRCRLARDGQPHPAHTWQRTGDVPRVWCVGTPQDGEPS